MQEAMPTVLVVEDEAAIRRLTSLSLEAAGMRAVSAANGQEALKLLEGVRPDAIVLDLTMPVMDGRTFYRHLRELGSQIPVMLLTAHSPHAAQQELQAQGAMAKPFDPFQLAEQVRALTSQTSPR
jgi:CheY-like chemotaxis protein